MFETISVVGLGYIGLPTAAMFASRKVRVIGVDVNENTVATINSGGVHIVEPDLDIAVHSAVEQGYLRATTKPEPAQAFLIAVPTPFLEGHVPDLSYIESAARAIAPVLARGNIVVLESTSPVGATEQLAAWLAEERPDLTFPQTHGEDSDIRIAHCPERVLPGKVMQELIHNDRVIGGLSPRCSEVATSLYRTFVDGKCVTTDARTAEMAKLTENSFRDVNIAFANELSLICEDLDISVWELIELSNLHPRVNILQPGPGVGGHCIAVDPWFIIHRNREKAKIIRAAREVNDSKPKWVIEQVKDAVAAHDGPEEPVLALYGIAFKPDIDDLRESPAVHIARELLDLGFKTLIVEPHIEALPASLSSARMVEEAKAFEIADIHVMLVDHTRFRNSPSPTGCLIDCRGVWRT
ncbi:UDP-N-acetyl-D-mannosamine dehydrogenase [Sphingomicrobium aestuariivivum]|nr:UDP-N-acetyl-D-mannosamine dehydrogenase [Sphingomicrobium aestuariivivum]